MRYMRRNEIFVLLFPLGSDVQTSWVHQWLAAFSRKVRFVYAKRLLLNASSDQMDYQMQNHAVFAVKNDTLCMMPQRGVVNLTHLCRFACPYQTSFVWFARRSKTEVQAPLKQILSRKKQVANGPIFFRVISKCNGNSYIIA